MGIHSFFRSAFKTAEAKGPGLNTSPAQTSCLIQDPRSTFISEQRRTFFELSDFKGNPTQTCCQRVPLGNWMVLLEDFSHGVGRMSHASKYLFTLIQGNEHGDVMAMLQPQNNEPGSVDDEHLHGRFGFLAPNHQDSIKTKHLKGGTLGAV